MRIKTNRRQSDLVLIFVTVFGLIGGLIVFSSFAYSRPVSLMPGELTKELLVKNYGSELRLQIEPNKSYCFLPTEIPTSIPEEPQLIQVQSTDSTCFSATSKTIVEINLDNVGSQFRLTVK